MTGGPDGARAAAEASARASYGRLVAILAAPTRDLALAEDCLADAFERALRTWPEAGVPDNPEGWLLTVARNRQRDALGSAAHRTGVELDPLERDAATSPLDAVDPDAIPDRRLQLLFVCAHPAIDPGIRTPLMLQTVLGFDAAQIGAAFAVPAATMAQRLVRAKKRITAAGIPFRLPERSEMADRLPPVLEAVYGAYAIDWAGAGRIESMGAEARYLATTLARLLDESGAPQPEAWGLAATITLSMARAPSRRVDDYVPLDEQDPAEWDPALIAEGNADLGRATGTGGPGRFQLEAAIQSVHCARAVTGLIDWHALTRLYRALLIVAPSLGAEVALAVAIEHTDGPDAALARIELVADPARERFQPWWAARAHLLAEAGRVTESWAAYDRAIELSDDPAVREWLRIQSAP